MPMMPMPPGYDPNQGLDLNRDALMQEIRQRQGASFEGFDLNKTYDPRSPKGIFLNTMRQGGYAHTPEGLQQGLGALQGAYSKAHPGMTVGLGGSKGDRLQFGGQLAPELEGLSEFDVIRAAGEGGKAFQWGGVGGPETPHGGAGAAGGPVGGGRFGGQDFGPMTSGPQDLTIQTRQLIEDLLSGNSNRFLRELMAGGQR